MAFFTVPLLLLSKKIKPFIFSSSVLLLCVHTQYNPFAHPSRLYYYLLSPINSFCTSYLFLHILLVLHISLFYYTFYSLFLFFTYIYALVLLLLYNFYSLHCPLSGPDLIYISLLIIHCIIYYVTNKETLNLEPISNVVWMVLNYFIQSYTQTKYTHIQTSYLLLKTVNCSV